MELHVRSATESFEGFVVVNFVLYTIGTLFSLFFHMSPLEYQKMLESHLVTIWHKCVLIFPDETRFLAFTNLDHRSLHILHALRSSADSGSLLTLVRGSRLK